MKTTLKFHEKWEFFHEKKKFNNLSTLSLLNNLFSGAIWNSYTLLCELHLFKWRLSYSWCRLNLLPLDFISRLFYDNFISLRAFFRLRVVSLTVSGIVFNWKISNWAIERHLETEVPKVLCRWRSARLYCHQKSSWSYNTYQNDVFDSSNIYHSHRFPINILYTSYKKGQLWAFEGEEKIIYNPTRAHGDIYKLKTSRPTKVKICQSFPFFLAC